MKMLSCFLQAFFLALAPTYLLLAWDGLQVQSVSSYRISRLPPAEFSKVMTERIANPAIRTIRDHLQNGVSEPKSTYDPLRKTMVFSKGSNSNYLSASLDFEYIQRTVEKKSQTSQGGLFIYKLDGKGIVTGYHDNPIYKDTGPSDYENKNYLSEEQEKTPNESEVTYEKGDLAPKIIDIFYIDQQGTWHRVSNENIYPEGSYSRLLRDHPGLRSNWKIPFPHIPVENPLNWPPWDERLRKAEVEVADIQVERIKTSISEVRKSPTGGLCAVLLYRLFGLPVSG